MKLYRVGLISGPAGEDVVYKLFLILSHHMGDERGLSPDGYNAIEVWANPAEPAAWIVDDEPTFLRSDRIWPNASGFQFIGTVSRVLVDVANPAVARKAAEAI